MNKAVMLSFIAVLLVFGGCAFMNKVAPSALDEVGQPIAGTHELTPLAKDVTGAIPYGETAAGILLFAWNFWERAKSKRTEKGLMATIRAIEAAGNDPATQEAIAALKLKLADAHKTADVQPLVNRLLSQIKFKV